MRAALDTAEDVLRELLRLYDWRFVIAEKEKEMGALLFLEREALREEIRKNLLTYGMEKKVAWARAREVLGEGDV